MKWKEVYALMLFLFLINPVYSQRKLPANSYNRIGIQGGINYGKIASDDFDFNNGAGYSAGFSTKATAGKHFLFLYGINFFKVKTSMEVRESISLEPAEIDFNLSGAQVNFFLGYRVLEDYLSLEIGPILQFNGKLSPGEDKEDYWLKDYDINVDALENISKMNMSLVAQLSGGFPKLKLCVQYQYGISNMFGDIEIQSFPEENAANEDLRGKMRMATAGIVFYL